ncbi:hypothetical protein Bbelb_175260 [Branchiostoma belcheri]|nr:hypothetical protein Bbelb_175260 [Branchiostoma belcheri]
MNLNCYSPDVSCVLLSREEHAACTCRAVRSEFRGHGGDWKDKFLGLFTLRGIGRVTGAAGFTPHAHVDPRVGRMQGMLGTPDRGSPSLHSPVTAVPQPAPMFL